MTAAANKFNIILINRDSWIPHFLLYAGNNFNLGILPQMSLILGFTFDSPSPEIEVLYVGR
jgi:hypothetical protein